MWHKYTIICNNICISIISQRWTMDSAAFLEYLKNKGLDDKAARRQLAIAEYLDVMMEARNKANGSGCGKRAARSLIDYLVEAKQDTVDNISAVLRYGQFVGNDDIYVEAFQILDGLEAMDNLYSRLAEIAGVETRDSIFSLIPEISPGTAADAKAAAMRTVIGKALELLDQNQKDELFMTSFRDFDVKEYEKDRCLFLECGGVDSFIDAKKRQFLEELRASMRARRLFFGQEITPNVISYVEADPEMHSGKRDGANVYITKIPFRAKQWLEEKDPKVRRYLYCHCPWARESILSQDGSVTAEFCRCSAGFHKKAWEEIFQEQLKCEVIESVLAGDERCRFKLSLPHRAVL